MKTVALMSTFFLLAIGLIPNAAYSYELMTKTETVMVKGVEIDIIRTADNFIILYDTSSSMDETYKETGKRKIDLEKAILKIRNAALPNFKYNAGLYTFTPAAFSFEKKALKAFYPMKPYNKAEFDKAIDQLPTKASGTTLLQAGLTELKDILAGLSGRTLVFVVSDGDYTESAMGREKPLAIAKELASKYDVSFYVINSSTTEKEAKMLEAVASINESSRVITFEQFIENPLALSGALFVVDARVVEKAVNFEKIVGAKLKHMLFDYNQAAVRAEYSDGLRLLAEALRDNPDNRLVLNGFTDSTGPEEYNLGLSRQRVAAFAMYLEKNFNIDPTQISLNWYGEGSPVASNDTAEGRQLNRRVEGFVIVGDESADNILSAN